MPLSFKLFLQDKDEIYVEVCLVAIYCLKERDKNLLKFTCRILMFSQICYNKMKGLWVPYVPNTGNKHVLICSSNKSFVLGLPLQ